MPKIANVIEIPPRTKPMKLNAVLYNQPNKTKPAMHEIKDSKPNVFFKDMFPR